VRQDAHAGGEAHGGYIWSGFPSLRCFTQLGHAEVKKYSPPGYDAGILGATMDGNGAIRPRRERAAARSTSGAQASGHFDRAFVAAVWLVNLRHN
jgi:hypothetical protein